MADIRGAEEYVKKQEWAQDNRKKAEQLLLDALVFQNELFDNGDLKPYLSMLSKMRHQNSRNLLLLMNRMPSATCLTGYRIWQRRLPDPAIPVLRRGQAGKGIDLLVPFTDLSRSAITWYAATHFDVSQVNVNYHPFSGPYKPENSNHISLLISAVSAALGEYYHTNVLSASDPEDVEMLSSTNTEGSMFPGFFMLRPDLPFPDKLSWLTVSLCRLFLQHLSASSPYDNYLSLCASDCLFRIWGVPELSRLSAHPALIMSVPKEQRQNILDYLQHCVQTVEAQISDFYADAASLDAETDPTLNP